MFRLLASARSICSLGHQFLPRAPAATSGSPRPLQLRTGGQTPGTAATGDPCGRLCQRHRSRRAFFASCVQNPRKKAAGHGAEAAGAAIAALMTARRGCALGGAPRAHERRLFVRSLGAAVPAQAAFLEEAASVLLRWPRILSFLRPSRQPLGRCVHAPAKCCMAWFWSGVV